MVETQEETSIARGQAYSFSAIIAILDQQIGDKEEMDLRRDILNKKMSELPPDIWILIIEFLIGNVENEWNSVQKLEVVEKQTLDMYLDEIDISQCVKEPEPYIPSQLLTEQACLLDLISPKLFHRDIVDRMYWKRLIEYRSGIMFDEPCVTFKSMYCEWMKKMKLLQNAELDRIKQLTAVTEKVQEVKVVFFGDQRVGKSALIVQFVVGVTLTSYDYDPTIEDTYRKQLQIDQDNVALFDIIDSAGSPEFYSLHKTYLIPTSVYAFVCSAEKVETLERMVFMLGQAMKQFKNFILPCVFILNKMDVEDKQVTREMVEQAIKPFHLLNYSIFETSVQMCNQTEDIFRELYRKFLISRVDLKTLITNNWE